MDNKICSITLSCPTMTLAISFLSAWCFFTRFSTAATSDMHLLLYPIVCKIALSIVHIDVNVGIFYVFVHPFLDGLQLFFPQGQFLDFEVVLGKICLMLIVSVGDFHDLELRGTSPGIIFT